MLGMGKHVNEQSHNRAETGVGNIQEGISGDGDQRAFARVAINKEFESFDAFVHEYVTNVSRTGVFVRSQEPLAIGTEVDLEFTVITDSVETIHGTGEVVRVTDDPPGMGVVFTELKGYSGELLNRLLTQAKVTL